MKTNSTPALLTWFLLMFCLISCDLFNPLPENDLEKKIDAAVRWANAARLTVTVAYPQEWGTGSPPQGQITPAMDIRQGYPFEIEFTPDIEFNLSRWRAYETEALVGVSWRTDITLLDETDGDGNPLRRTLSEEEVEIPTLPARGGRGVFVINTTKPVTLIPYCKSEPYVTRTEPRSNVEGLWPVMQDIVIHFNGALDPEMAWTLGAGMISINEIDADGSFIRSLNHHYANPVYQSRFGQHTVAISPGITNPPADGLLVEMTVGPNIRNVHGIDMTNTTEKVYWTTTSAGLPQGYITGWGASFTGNSIDVTSAKYIDPDTTSDAGEIRGYWQEGYGTMNVLANSTIPNAPSINSGGVRHGDGVSNVREYRLRLELVASGIIIDEKEFRIWNIPGMTVTSTNTNLLNNANFAEVMQGIGTGEWGADENYVLTEKITVTSHTPIANFQGKFYGNGHTITINSFDAAYMGADIGLFGVTDNALIRDLKIVYAAPPPPINGSSSTTNVGGIVGRATGNTQIINCIVEGSGNTTLTVTAFAETRLGGIVGYLDGESSIQNCLAALNVTLFASTAQTLHVGGVIGYGNSTGTITDVESVATVSMNKTGNAGGNNNCGGIAGFIASTNLSNCNFTGRIDIPNTFSASGTSRIGGITGGIITTTEAEVTITRSNASGNLTFRNIGGGDDQIYLGGIVGQADGKSNSVTFTDCHYFDGNITYNKSGEIRSYLIYIGGFAGQLYHDIVLNNCSSRAGLVKINYTASVRPSNLLAGGFSAAIRGDIEKCFSTSPVEVVIATTDSDSIDFFHVGGFAGEIQNDFTVQQCYASGEVTIESNARDARGYMVGGFFGQASNDIKFIDCYAAGNVTVSRSGTINRSSVGGFGGNIESPDTNTGHGYGAGIENLIQRCFATGLVRITHGAAGTVNAGGLIGTVNDSVKTKIQNSVSFGPSVVVQGGTLDYGRISGTANAAFTGNHAVSTLKLLVVNNSNGNLEDKVAMDATANAKDGATAIRDLINSAFWRGLGFSDTIWDLGTPVTRNGWPTLRGVGGQ